MIRPSPSPITLSYGYHDGYPLNSGVHRGVDFSHTPDEGVYMPEDGNISYLPLNGNDGNAIYIQVGNRRHALCHLKQNLVPSGSYQREGSKIGIMGDTGYAQGVHLHWAVTVGGQFVDPLTLVKEKPMIDKSRPNEGDVINVFRFFGYEPNENDKAAAYKRDNWNDWWYQDVITHAKVKERMTPNTAELQVDQIKKILGC